tara:strand:- start:656 stop:1120 length:465 start_codon:yes stop_codon:yes gene_type:complete
MDTARPGTIYRLFAASSGISYYGSTRIAIEKRYKAHLEAYCYYKKGLPRTGKNGHVFKQPWLASFKILERLGKEIVQIEAVQTFDDIGDKQLEYAEKLQIQLNDCVNYVYKRWPHTDGYNSDLIVTPKNIGRCEVFDMFSPEELELYTSTGKLD